MDNVEEPPNRIQKIKHTLISGVPCCCIKGQERVCIQHLKVTYAIDLPLGGHHLPPMGYRWLDRWLSRETNGAVEIQHSRASFWQFPSGISLFFCFHRSLMKPGDSCCSSDSMIVLQHFQIYSARSLPAGTAQRKRIRCQHTAVSCWLPISRKQCEWILPPPGQTATLPGALKRCGTTYYWRRSRTAMVRVGRLWMIHFWGAFNANHIQTGNHQLFTTKH